MFVYFFAISYQFRISYNNINVLLTIISVITVITVILNPVNV